MVPTVDVGVILLEIDGQRGWSGGTGSVARHGMGTVLRNGGGAGGTTQDQEGGGDDGSGQRCRRMGSGRTEKGRQLGGVAGGVNGEGASWEMGNGGEASWEMEDGGGGFTGDGRWWMRRWKFVVAGAWVEACQRRRTEVSSRRTEEMKRGGSGEEEFMEDGVADGGNLTRAGGWWTGARIL